MNRRRVAGGLLRKKHHAGLLGLLTRIFDIEWWQRRGRGIFFRGTWRANSLTPRAVIGLLNTSSPVIFELGAADGLDTLKFAAACSKPGLRIVAVEPDPRNIKKFEAAVNDPRVHLVKCAVGANDGQEEFHLSSTGYSSSLKKPALQAINKRWAEINFDEDIIVEVKKLDSIRSAVNVDSVDFIWADVQGAEDLLIRGGPNTLRNTHYFYTEHNSCGEPLYAGDSSLSDICKQLGDNWKLLRNYGDDALFENQKFSKNGPVENET